MAKCTDTVNGLMYQLDELLEYLKKFGVRGCPATMEIQWPTK